MAIGLSCQRISDSHHRASVNAAVDLIVLALNQVARRSRTPAGGWPWDPRFRDPGGRHPLPSARLQFGTGRDTGQRASAAEMCNADFDTHYG